MAAALKALGKIKEIRAVQGPGPGLLGRGTRDDSGPAILRHFCH
jgi:hypothetical protein